MWRDHFSSCELKRLRAKIRTENRAITKARLLHLALLIQPAKIDQGFIPQLLMQGQKPLLIVLELLDTRGVLRVSSRLKCTIAGVLNSMARKSRTALTFENFKLSLCQWWLLISSS